MTITKPNLVLMTGHWRHLGLLGLKETLEAITGNHASDYHDNVVAALRGLGWEVQREYAVSLNGRGGRVDVVAFRHDWKLALELDNRSPRGRSIEKLKLFSSDWLTGILLRDPK